MILYHGSFVVVDKPDLLHSRPNVDFGKGFYVTPIYEQAEKWSKRFKKLGKDGIISSYKFDVSAYKTLKVLSFETYSEDWLNFILNCRKGKDTIDYDLVIGGVANDKVFNTVELFFDGLIDKTEAIKRLQYEKPNLQISFRSNEALSYLEFEGSNKL
jgi:DNA-binding Lrp family transcriptional regulator